MARHLLDLDDLGYETSWLLIQQVLGMPDPRMQSDFLSNKVAMLLFFRPSLPERLCITAAVRQMSGSTIYQGNPDEGWGNEFQDFQSALMPILGYYLDFIYIYGMPLEKMRKGVGNINVPLINAGSPESHPAHALADLACMLKLSKDIKGAKTAWIGCANGTLYSLMKTAEWFKFSLKISMPEDKREYLKKYASSLDANISFTASPEEAVRDAAFIYAGWRGDLTHSQLETWKISPQLMRLTQPSSHLLLCASPMRAISISPEVLESKVSILNRQAEYRLRLHKRILHWLLEK